MSHNHTIVDTGKYFVIDTLLRTITTETSELVLSQGDHNSERYTFEIPRMVEGHDMSLCNRIEVHYDNISKNKKETNEGFDVVTDAAVNGDDLRFSWLISGNATRLAGTIQFWINFICTDENDEIIYSWGTDIFKGVRVLANNRNTDTVVATFPDVLAQWKKEVFDEVGANISAEDIAAAVSTYLKENPVQPGATTEQAAQIKKNAEDIEALQKAGNSGNVDLYNGVTMTDRTTGKKYVVYISDGKLTMDTVETESEG